MRGKPLYKIIAERYLAMSNLRGMTLNDERLSAARQAAYGRHVEQLEWLTTNALPQGGGYDCVIVTSNQAAGESFGVSGDYHLMNENGYYVGWVGFSLNITASLVFDFDLVIDVEVVDTEDEAADTYYLAETIAEDFGYALRQRWVETVGIPFVRAAD